MISNDQLFVLDTAIFDAVEKNPNVIEQCELIAWSLTLFTKSADKVSMATVVMPQKDPVTMKKCKHEWFRTGAMHPTEKRCIKCGEWGVRE